MPWVLIVPYYTLVFLWDHIRERSSLYLRYIDDIFIIWNDSKESFINFIKDLNTRHASIKFDYKISEEGGYFLDTTVFIDQNDKLQTKLYRKPTDRQNYLHQSSDHQPSLKPSNAYGQALRLKRICSVEEDLIRNCDHLKAYMVKRGYKPDEIDSQIQRVLDIPRSTRIKRNVDSMG